jgi:hypothetical protein
VQTSQPHAPARPQAVPHQGHIKDPKRANGLTVPNSLCTLADLHLPSASAHSALLGCAAPVAHQDQGQVALPPSGTHLPILFPEAPTKMDSLVKNVMTSGVTPEKARHILRKRASSSCLQAQRAAPAGQSVTGLQSSPSPVLSPVPRTALFKKDLPKKERTLFS